MFNLKPHVGLFCSLEVVMNTINTCWEGGAVAEQELNRRRDEQKAADDATKPKLDEVEDEAQQD